MDTYDPIDRPEKDGYLRLAGADVRSRIRYHPVAGVDEPRVVDILYIDSTHGRQETIDEFTAWSQHLQAGAVVVFDDYNHPDYPGVKEAVAALELDGTQTEGLFIHTVCADTP